MYAIPLLAAAMCLPSCAEPEFQPFVGNSVRVGTGGTVQMVQGVQVWENGDPPRRYRVLGFMEEEGGTRATKGTVLNDLAKAAASHGAQAMIVMAAGNRISGVDQDELMVRPKVKVMLIRYL